MAKTPPATAAEDASSLPPRHYELHLFRLLVLVLFGVLLVRTAWLSDDIFITARTIDNFLHGHGLRWNIAERVQTYTHPLWMFLLILPHALTGEAFWSTHVFSMAISMLALGVLLWKFTTRPGQVAAVAAAVFFCNSYVDYSTSGLENPLSHLLVVCFCLYTKRSEARPANLRTGFLFLSLFVLTRHDLLLIALPPLLWCIDWRNLDRRALRNMAIGLSPLILWEIFSLVYYGFPVPNTAYAKLGGGLPKDTVIAMGFNYVVASFLYDPLPLVTIAAGVGAAFFGGANRLRVLSASAVLYTLYIVWAGGDFMAGRFLTVPFLLSLLVLVERVGPLKNAAGVLPWAAASACIGLVFTPTPVLGTSVDYSQRTEAFPWTKGVCSERAYYYPHTSFLRNIFDDELSRQVWVRYGKAVRATERRTVHIYGAIGFRGYFGGPDFHIIDYNALCDPLLARLPATHPAERSGHLARHIPAGYAATHEHGENRLEDPSLAQYYDVIQRVTSAPVFSLDRLQAIVAMNLRRYDHLVDREYYTYPDALHRKAAAFARPAATGARWDAPGHTKLPYGGVYIELGAIRHDPNIQLALDWNDTYRVRFFQADDFLGQLDFGPSPTVRRGMDRYSKPIPADIAQAGYDRIHLIPVTGDEKFSVGHVLFGSATGPVE